MLWLSDNRDIDPHTDVTFIPNRKYRLNSLFYQQKLVQFTEATGMRAKTVNY